MARQQVEGMAVCSRPGSSFTEIGGKAELVGVLRIGCGSFILITSFPVLKHKAKPTGQGEDEQISVSFEDRSTRKW